MDTLLGLSTGDPDQYAAGTTCDLLDKLGAPCEPCPGNPEQQSCVTLQIEGAEGFWQDQDGLDPLELGDLDTCD